MRSRSAELRFIGIFENRLGLRRFFGARPSWPQRRRTAYASGVSCSHLRGTASRPGWPRSVWAAALPRGGVSWICAARLCARVHGYWLIRYYSIYEHKLVRQEQGMGVLLPGFFAGRWAQVLLGTAQVECRCRTAKQDPVKPIHLGCD